MLNYSLLKNRRAQVAESMTWIIATIIIIFLIVSSIYISSLLGKSKNLSVKGIDSSEKNDLVLEKTKMALEINGDNQEVILAWVKNSLEGENGN